MVKTSRGSYPPQQKVETISGDNAVDTLASEFRLNKEKVFSILRSVGVNLETKSPADSMSLYREVIACKLGDRSRFVTEDTQYQEELDEQLRSFDEIYVDTAPIIQEDWFLHFVTNAEPILKRRKKKLIILEKTLEELHGLKDNPEKDKEVRIRSTIRPDLIRQLAKRGLVRIGDTGSQGIADDHLVRLFRQIGTKKNLLLITQDRGLSERIVRLSQELEAERENQNNKPWYKKLFTRKPTENQNNRMVVCKLVDEGKLKRCYICPECDESYYDDMHECEGMVLCGRCYLNLKEQESKQEQENQKRREEELKAEEERQKKMEEQEKRLAEERSQDTVENRLRKRRNKVSKILATSTALVVLLIVIVLVLIF